MASPRLETLYTLAKASGLALLMAVVVYWGTSSVAAEAPGTALRQCASSGGNHSHQFNPPYGPYTFEDPPDFDCRIDPLPSQYLSQIEQTAAGFEGDAETCVAMRDISFFFEFVEWTGAWQNLRAWWDPNTSKIGVHWDDIGGDVIAHEAAHGFGLGESEASYYGDYCPDGLIIYGAPPAGNLVRGSASGSSSRGFVK